MNAAERRALFRQVVFVSWGMLTAVLVFCLGILVYEMIQKGQNPLEIVEAETPVPEQLRPDNGTAPAVMEEVLLYFAQHGPLGLAPEPRRITFSDYTVENCRKALEALIEGPRDRDSRAPIIAPGTQVRACYLLEGGELVLDFSRELIVEHKKIKSASLEALLFYGIVHTMAQSALRGAKDQPVQQVRFLIEGSPPTEAFPAHLDVSGPLTPNPDWAPTGARGPDVR